MPWPMPCHTIGNRSEGNMEDDLTNDLGSIGNVEREETQDMLDHEIG